jgi:hypothetical protein
VGAPRLRRRARAVALRQARRTQLGQATRGALLLGPRIAVAEVPGQIERQPLGQRQRLANRLGVLGEAGDHRLGRAHHMTVVAATQRLAGVERGVVAERHERVLQLGPGARVRVDVAGGHASDPQPPGVRCQRTVARAIVAGVWALQLHVQALRAERVEQPPGHALPILIAAGRRAREHGPSGAARQADEALGVVDHRLHVHPRLRQLASSGGVAGVPVGEGDDPAEVAPAALVAHEQRDVARPGRLGGGGSAVATPATAGAG